MRVLFVLLFLFFTSYQIYGQSMRELQEKVESFITPETLNYDSIIYYSTKIINKSNKYNYPRDINYLTYGQILAISLTQKQEFNRSISITDSIISEFGDTLLKYNDLNLELKNNQLINYYWTKDIEGYAKVSIDYLKLLIDNNSDVNYNIDFMLTVVSQLCDYNKFEEALDCYHLIIKNYEKIYLNNRKFYLNGQSLLVTIQIKKGYFKDAINTCNQVLENSKLDNSYQKRQFKISKTTALVGLNKYTLALQLNSEIINELNLDNSGLNIDTIAFTYIQHASIYNHLGNKIEAKKYFEKALNIFEINSTIENKKNYAWALAHYAGFLQESGQYSLSLEKNKAALMLRQQSPEENIYQIINLYNNIAENYFSLCNYSEAVVICEKALKLCNENYDKTYPITFQTMSNLAVMQNAIGNIERAIELDIEVLEIKKLKFGEKSLDVSNTLNNLACLYISINEYDKAISLLQKALKIRIDILGENHPLCALSLSNLALCYSNLGDLKKSLELNKKSVKVYEELGLLTGNYSTTLDNLGISYGKLDSLNLAYQYVLMGYKNNMNIFYSNQGLNDQLSFDSKNRLFSSEQLALNAFSKSTEKIGSLYELIINTNGALSQNKFLLDEMVNDIGFEIQRQDLLEIKKLKAKLIKVEEGGENASISEILEIKDRIEYLEVKLNKLLFLEGKSIKVSAISNSLKKDEVFIDIIPYKKYDFKQGIWSNSEQYLTVITNSKDTIIDYCYLDKNPEIIREMYELYLLNVTNSNLKSELKDSVFYNLFWQPIADKIGDAKTIYVSLGGVYNNINLNTLYNPTTGKYLLEEMDIRIVNNAREFVLSKESEKKVYTTNSASLFGFPNFDGNTSVSSDSLDLFSSNRDLSSFWLDSLTRGGMKAKPLPETKKEVENISNTLKLQRWVVNSFLAANASEINIKKLQSPRILHIATHGYFFQDIPMEDGKDRFLGIEKEKVIQDPMLRSGLLLSGANRTLKGEVSIGENGLLSAAEASLLNLRETELVVLSACETGKGEETNSEGVYGLRKAFSDAGAQNIIMSLWKVDDKVTQEFMSRFYEIWINEKTTIRQAFNRTQLEIKAKYPEPYYWGAFILVGE